MTKTTMTGAPANAHPWVVNQGWRPGSTPLSSPEGTTGPREFHRSMPDYRVTPLTEISAADLAPGVGRVLVKDESSRLGLPAFKMLGASWATCRAIASLSSTNPPADLDLLRSAVSDLPPLTLVTATDGNHGRAVARIARYLRLHALILIPSSVPSLAVDLIRQEGAEVRVLDVSYDETVMAAARASEAPDHLLIQDTAWAGYEAVPQWIVDGYSTLFLEADEQLREQGLRPDVIVVPAGVGSLAHAAVLHARGFPGARILVVEPDTAACITESIIAGTSVSVATGTTVMAGLNCGTPSSIAIADILSDVRAAVTVSDQQSLTAAEQLKRAGVDAGPCGAATLAGLQRALDTPAVRDALDIGPSTSVLLLNTEGSHLT